MYTNDDPQKQTQMSNNRPLPQHDELLVPYPPMPQYVQETAESGTATINSINPNAPSMDPHSSDARYAEMQRDKLANVTNGAPGTSEGTRNDSAWRHVGNFIISRATRAKDALGAAIQENRDTVEAQRALYREYVRHNEERRGDAQTLELVIPMAVHSAMKGVVDNGELRKIIPELTSCLSRVKDRLAANNTATPLGSDEVREYVAETVATWSKSGGKRSSWRIFTEAGGVIRTPASDPGSPNPRYQLVVGRLDKQQSHRAVTAIIDLQDGDRALGYPDQPVGQVVVDTEFADMFNVFNMASEDELQGRLRSNVQLLESRGIRPVMQGHSFKSSR
jgi:hypothetical protein